VATKGDWHSGAAVAKGVKNTPRVNAKYKILCMFKISINSKFYFIIRG
jgi:hypothetical protein